MGKHLEFYKKCMSTGDMDYSGLCRAADGLEIDRNILDLLMPTSNDKDVLVEEGILDRFWRFGFWACGLPVGHPDRCNKFTPLRQTIVLFMAAINDEL